MILFHILLLQNSLPFLSALERSWLLHDTLWILILQPLSQLAMAICTLTTADFYLTDDAFCSQEKLMRRLFRRIVPPPPPLSSLFYYIDIDDGPHI